MSKSLATRILNRASGFALKAAPEATAAMPVGETPLDRLWASLPVDRKAFVSGQRKVLVGQGDAAKLVLLSSLGVPRLEAAYTGDIDKDFTATDVDTVAQVVAEDKVLGTKSDPDRRMHSDPDADAKIKKLAAHLMERARAIYKANVKWGQKLAKAEDGEAGARDQLYEWMGHWADSWINHGGKSTEEARGQAAPVPVKAGRLGWSFQADPDGVPSTQPPIFDSASAKSAVSEIKAGIKAPFVSVVDSSLGGPENVSILLAFSLEPKEKWENSIFENSPYARFHIYNNGNMELFAMGHHAGQADASGRRDWKNAARLPKFRKTKVKSVADAIAKINAYISEAETAKGGAKDVQANRLKAEGYGDSFRPKHQDKCEVCGKQEVGPLMKRADGYHKVCLSCAKNWPGYVTYFNKHGWFPRTKKELETGELEEDAHAKDWEGNIQANRLKAEEDFKPNSYMSWPMEKKRKFMREYAAGPENVGIIDRLTDDEIDGFFSEFADEQMEEWMGVQRGHEEGAPMSPSSLQAAGGKVGKDEATISMDSRDPYDQLDDRKLPAVICEFLGPDQKKSAYSAKEVSLNDVRKAAEKGTWKVAVWCTSSEEASRMAKELDARDTTKGPVEPHWEVPPSEQDGEGIKKTTSPSTGQPLQTAVSPTKVAGPMGTDAGPSPQEQIQKLKRPDLVMGRKGGLPGITKFRTVKAEAALAEDGREIVWTDEDRDLFMDGEGNIGDTYSARDAAGDSRNPHPAEQYDVRPFDEQGKRLFIEKNAGEEEMAKLQAHPDQLDAIFQESLDLYASKKPSPPVA